MIKHTTPTSRFAEYTITAEQRTEIERLALKVGKKSSSGTYWLNECFSNLMGLTPRHISENFENVDIAVGMDVPENQTEEYWKQIERKEVV